MTRPHTHHRRSRRNLPSLLLLVGFALTSALTGCGGHDGDEQKPPHNTGAHEKQGKPQAPEAFSEPGPEYAEPDTAYADMARPGAPLGASVGAVRSGPPSAQSMATEQVLAVQTDDVQKAKSQALKISHDAGGTTQEQKEQDATDKVPGWVQLTLKIPVDKVEDAVAKLRTLGDVKYFTSHSTNVSQQSTDVSADIALVQQTIARLQQIYAQAAQSGKADDMVSAEKELIEQNDRLQQLKRQQQGLGGKVETTTVGVVLLGKKSAPPEHGWVGSGLHSGWSDLVATVKWLVTAISWLAVWLVPLAVVVVVARFGWRLVRTKRA
ncbi:hypothetical protein Srot_2261 [Segniliparus rotundus DSM 44985]|uniref:DUF4349 domain-containing protein n=1 Tax=Segniliparus rotundus (strain ATCC BAA-972 / CDC 1076 / CIP 108378 / DSM 44985 / JCM 13578) TaxID=640132 RepID=D6ZA41_SEGRD|nr:DUF4349 domain-containing protein [Segniliparus rotundus]ADG98711.1 hypothetical protein Srot_2261 [Segniliparus rotundus DSM 44985]